MKLSYASKNRLHFKVKKPIDKHAKSLATLQCTKKSFSSRFFFAAIVIFSSIFVVKEHLREIKNIDIYKIHIKYLTF